jgi:hypothetical protein
VNIRQISLHRSNITQQHHPILINYQPDMVAVGTPGVSSISTAVKANAKSEFSFMVLARSCWISLH